LTITITKKAYDPEFVRKVEEISGQNFHMCMQCGTCSGGCPMTELMDCPTRRILLLTHYGMKEAVMAANTHWFCAACQTCYVRCPRGIDIPRVMEAIRQIALRENINYVEPADIPQEVLEELPQIALVSCFRKHTS